jgi:manganese/zinc/iron transport system substrate-binding protein
MVADLVSQIGGDRVEITGLMGPGVDPHLYKAAASDVIKLRQADVIFYNGLLLEGKMTDLFARMARINPHIHAIAESLPKDRLLQPPHYEGHYDPHVWFDIPLWSQCIEKVVQGLSSFQPASRDYFRQQADQTKTRFTALHQWALDKAAELPQAQRILITSHDAYSYFGRAYGFQVVGLQGISTVTEAGLADVAKMADFIKLKKVKSIFVESSVSPAAIQRISQDAGVRIGGELFSDAMGTPGQMENGYDLGTYEGMIKHNLTTMINGLK